MRDTNWTLKFPRTWREATGFDARSEDFSHRAWDKIVLWACTHALAFIAGLLLA